MDPVLNSTVATSEGSIRPHRPKTKALKISTQFGVEHSEASRELGEERAGLPTSTLPPEQTPALPKVSRSRVQWDLDKFGVFSDPTSACSADDSTMSPGGREGEEYHLTQLDMARNTRPTYSPSSRSAADEHGSSQGTRISRPLDSEDLHADVATGTTTGDADTEQQPDKLRRYARVLERCEWHEESDSRHSQQQGPPEEAECNTEAIGSAGPGSMSVEAGSSGRKMLKAVRSDRESWAYAVGVWSGNEQPLVTKR